MKIEAVGLDEVNRRLPPTTAWIVNAQTRETVWEMTEENSNYRGKRLNEINESVSLPRGNYEVYYAFYPTSWSYSSGARNFGDAVKHAWNEIFEDGNNRDYSYYRDKQRELKIAIRGVGRSANKDEVTRWQNEYKADAIITMTALWDDRYEKQGFTLDRSLDLQIYAVGETGWDNDWNWSRKSRRADEQELYDHGWIINTQTREKVWKFTYADSKPAGGAPKNRLINQTLALPAGSYAAFFVTDDSHSERRWNAAPPHDPSFWGLTIRVKDPALKASVKKFDYEPLPDKNVVANLTKLGDEEFRTVGFTLKRPLDVRIYAIGEGRDDAMFDYGWIIEAKTHKKVWEMNFDETEHAGGASKNRLFDGTRRLEAGSYLAYFVTDGSHSYVDWNSSAPYDQEHWGMVITAANDKFSADDVAPYEEKEDGSVLAQLIHVRDHDRDNKRFTMKSDGQVRVYAIGEGRDGDMFDFGWIEDASTGKTVWEMTYRMTSHAGGAKKNRLYDDVVALKAGDYIVHFETDDSHSFNDWNDDPPHDATHYGITLYAVP
ncbi:MAG: hypothetical protein ALAOOOJD_04670 [bacterium]|nr:hypothetical protein [bacterium]